MAELRPLPPVRSIGEILGQYMESGFACRIPEIESPLEDMFWNSIRKTRSMFDGADWQVPIGRFRVDSMFDCGGKKIVVEVDGKAYHDYARDAARDAILLQDVDEVIRIPYVAMCMFPTATMMVLSQWHERFAVPCGINCISYDDFGEVLEGAVENHDYNYSQDEFLRQENDAYEIWKADEFGGYVFNPRAFVRNSPSATIGRRRKGVFCG